MPLSNPVTTVTNVTGLLKSNPQSKEVNALAATAVTNNLQRQSIELQIIILESKLPRSAEEEDKLQKLYAELDKNKTEITEKDYTATSTMPEAHEVVNEVAKQESVEAAAKASPVPINNVQIKYASFDPNDLVSYINATTHLNPWGRMRQCDEDLKNLMTIVNRAANHRLGEFKQLLTQVADVATE